MSRPRIGLTTYREGARWGVWDEPADLLPASYSRSVADAGGVALLLPAPLEELEQSAAVLLDALDGLLVAGGADIDPRLYGAEPNPATGTARPERDAWELCLLAQAFGRGIPVLGICRGMQLLNAALGGSLIQHLPDVVGHDGHCPVVGVHGRHEVTVQPGSRLHAMLGGAAEVATYHHQAVDRIGAGLEPTAWTQDGTVEAVESSDESWIVAVQWHPEAHEGHGLFSGFVQACDRR